MLTPSCIKINILLSSSDYFHRERKRVLSSGKVKVEWNIFLSALAGMVLSARKNLKNMNIWENWGNAEIWALCTVTSPKYSWSLGTQGLPEGKVDPRQSIIWKLFLYNPKTQLLLQGCCSSRKVMIKNIKANWCLCISHLKQKMAQRCCWARCWLAWKGFIWISGFEPKSESSAWHHSLPNMSFTDFSYVSFP